LIALGARALLGTAPNRWDIVLLPPVLAVLFLAAWGSAQMAVPFHPGEALPLSLDPAVLPLYALRTTLRMAAAMLAALIFTFLYGSLAAHIRRVLDERIRGRAPKSRFLRELEDSLAEEEAERVLAVATDWGRYAEIFAYDDNAA